MLLCADDVGVLPLYVLQGHSIGKLLGHLRGIGFDLIA